MIKKAFSVSLCLCVSVVKKTFCCVSTALVEQLKAEC